MTMPPKISTAPAVVTVLLLATSAVVAIAGLLLLSQATLGVGALVFACLLAIFARISQSATQHSQIANPVASTAVTDYPQIDPATLVTNKRRLAIAAGVFVLLALVAFGAWYWWATEIYLKQGYEPR